MKRTYQPSNLVRKEGTVLEQEWQLKLEDQLIARRRSKGRKPYQPKHKWLSLKV